MRTKALLLLSPLLILAATAPAAAQTVSDTLQVVSGSSGARGVQILAFGPVGQSFTAIDSTLTSFGFQFQAFNPAVANSPVSFSLLAGAGLGGASIYAQSLTLPTTLPGRTGIFYDFGVPDLAVTIGNVYTAVLSSASTRVGVALGPEYNIYTGAPLGGDAYAGGRAYFATQPFGNCTNDASSNCDLNFRVSGIRAIAAAVPEPASWAMMILGLGLAGGALRRRRSAAAPA